MSEHIKLQAEKKRTWRKPVVYGLLGFLGIFGVKSAFAGGSTTQNRMPKPTPAVAPHNLQKSPETPNKPEQVHPPRAVLFIGDSLGEGDEQTGRIREQFAAHGWHDLKMDVVQSRPLYDPYFSGGDGFASLQANKQFLEGKVNPVVVFELGTNPHPDFQLYVDKIIAETLAINNTSQIYWGNFAVTRPDLVKLMSGQNTILSQESAAGRLTVVDRASVLLPGDDPYRLKANYEGAYSYVAGDGVHLNDYSIDARNYRDLILATAR